MSKVNPRVALIVDHAHRDLFGLTLVACELAANGIDCFLVPLYSGHELFFIKPDVVVFNYIRKNNISLINYCHRSGIATCVLDTEGLLFKDVDFFFKRLSENINDNLDLYLTWGPRQKDAMLKAGRMQADQVVVCGSPRHDACHSSFDQSLAGETLRKRFLINSNFPFVNPRFQRVDKERRDLKKIYSVSQTDIDEFSRQQLSSLWQLIETTKKLADDFNDFTFVYRAHPFENVDIYHKEFGTIRNIELEQDCSIFESISRSAAVIHYNCTTAIEAILMGKAALQPDWFNTPRLKQPLLHSTSILSENYETLKAQVESIAHGDTPAVNSEVREARDGFLSEYFRPIDGEAHKQVASAIKKIAVVRPKSASLFGFLFMSNWRERNFKRFFRNIILLFVGAGPAYALTNFILRRASTDVKNFTASQVEQYLQSIGHVKAARFKADRIVSPSIFSRHLATKSIHIKKV